MNHDTPAIPPHGATVLYALPVYLARDGAPDLTGLILARDGRLGITTAGAGLAVKLAAADAVELGLLLVQIGHALAAEEATAARDAGAALDRIAAKAGNA